MVSIMEGAMDVCRPKEQKKEKREGGRENERERDREIEEGERNCL